jgi:uncharacterized membrane protein
MILPQMLAALGGVFALAGWARWWPTACSA